jgi:hypothetical protein
MQTDAGFKTISYENHIARDKIYKVDETEK